MADFTYDVVRHRGCWRVLFLGRHSPSHPNQESAVKEATRLAREKLAAGREAEVRINRTDGEIVNVPLDDEEKPKAAPAA